MSFKSMNWIAAVCVFGVAFCCGAPRGMAEERSSTPYIGGAEANPDQGESLVQFETEGDISLGYRWLSTQDALKAAEYIYPHSSATFAVNLLSCPLPYRYHLNAELVSSHDLYMDAGFAYDDFVLFRDILTGVHHNLNHHSIQFDGIPGYLIYDERNRDENYYVDFVGNLLSLRLKAPDFPFHTFLNHRHVEWDGRVQQRFFQYLDNYMKVSESRDIDWTADAVRLGFNSHLGPLEAEYAYDRADFDPGGSSFLIDRYIYPIDDQESPFYIAESDDTYPHHVISETEASAHTVKMHSSYTGGIVTAATLSNKQLKNNYSGTESTTWKGAFDFTWIPKPRLGLFFKYRHTDVDIDNPGTVTLNGFNYGSVNTYTVRRAISYGKDVFTLSTRYKPWNILSLYANYKFSHLNRRDIDEWVLLPGHTNIHSLDATARFKPFNRMQVTAACEYQNYEQPAYNNMPDESGKLHLTASYTPAPTVNIYLDYILNITERDSLHYLNSDLTIPEADFDRDGKHHQLLASCSAALTSKITLSASWLYQRWKIKQDLAYGKMLDVNTFDQPYKDSSVPYADRSNSFTFSVQYLPKQDITLSGDINHTITKGTTGYTDVVGGSPFSLSSFSTVKTSETTLSCEVVKRFSRQWEIGLGSRVNIYNDRVDDALDGEVFVTTFNIKRFF